jgi:hypothetical protein
VLDIYVEMDVSMNKGVVTFHGCQECETRPSMMNEGKVATMMPRKKAEKWKGSRYDNSVPCG